MPATVSALPTTTGGEFTALTLALLRGRGEMVSALEVAKRDFRNSPRVESVLRAAVDAGALSEPSWAAALADYKRLSDGFVQSLAGVSAFDTLLPAMRRVPLHSRLILVTTGASGSVTAAAMARPLTSFGIADPVVLEPIQAGAQVVLSDDLVRHGGDEAMTMIAAELRQAVSAATDVEFLGGVLDGATEVVSTGATPSAILTDIETLLDVVFVSGASRPYLVLSPVEARKLATKADAGGRLAFPEATLRDGSLAGVPIIVSDQQPTGTVLALDAASLAAGSDVVTLGVARHATLEMDDAPGDPPATLTNLWQKNLRAIQATRYFAYLRLRDSGAAVLTGVTW